MATTSERLKEIISIRNVKQAEIVEHTGINKGALSSYISGRYLPKQDNIYKLAKFFNVNPAWLMGLDVSMEPPSEIDAEYDPAMVERALRFLKAYDSSNPDIQDAIQSLLKVHQSES